MSTKRNRPVLYEMVRRGQSSEAGAPISAGAPAARTEPVVQPTPVQPARAPRITALQTGSSVRLENGRIVVALDWQGQLITAAALLLVGTLLFFGGMQLERVLKASPASALNSDLRKDPDSSRIGGGGEGAGVAPGGRSSDASRKPQLERNADLNRGADPRTGDAATPKRRPTQERPDGAPADAAAREPDPQRPAPPAGDANRSAAAERPSAPAALENGKHYVFVQYFQKKDVDAGIAEEAKKFMAGKGIPCVLTKVGADTVLVATQSFDVAAGGSSARSAADELIKSIKTAGREFNKIGGYSFAGAELKKWSGK